MAKVEKKQGSEMLTRLSATLSEGAVTYSRFLIGLGAVLALAALVWVTYSTWATHSEEKAQAALYKVESVYLKKKEDFAQADAPKPSKKDEKEKQEKPLAKASGDLQKDYGTEIDGFKQLIAQRSGSKAAVLAAFDLAEIYLQYEKPEMALEALNQTGTKLSQRSFLGAVRLMKIAALEAQTKNCPKAVEHYTSVSKNPNWSYLHPEAMLRTGVCLEVMNQPEQAKAMYQQLSEKHSDTSAGQNAKKYLQLLESKGTGGKDQPS